MRTALSDPCNQCSSSEGKLGSLFLFGVHGLGFFWDKRWEEKTEDRTDPDEHLGSMIPPEIQLHTNSTCQFMIKEHHLLVSGQSYSTRTDSFVSWNMYITEVVPYSLRADMAALFSKCYHLYSEQQGQKVGRDKSDSLLLWIAFRVKKEQTQNTNTFCLARLPLRRVQAPTFSWQPCLQSTFWSVTILTLALLRLPAPKWNCLC